MYKNDFTESCLSVPFLLLPLFLYFPFVEEPERCHQVLEFKDSEVDYCPFDLGEGDDIVGSITFYLCVILIGLDEFLGI